jgi:hypothetical protein
LKAWKVILSILLRSTIAASRLLAAHFQAQQQDSFATVATSISDRKYDAFSLKYLPNTDPEVSRCDIELRPYIRYFCNKEDSRGGASRTRFNLPKVCRDGGEWKDEPGQVFEVCTVCIYPGHGNGGAMEDVK